MSKIYLKAAAPDPPRQLPRPSNKNPIRPSHHFSLHARTKVSTLELLIMEFPHHGESIYYRYQASFVRDWHGNLLYCNGPVADRISEFWHTIRVSLTKDNGVATKRRQVYQARLGEDLRGLTVYELYHASKGLVTGIILNDGVEDTTSKEDFVVFFNQLILHQVDFVIGSPKANPTPDNHHESATERIVSLFDTYLRYQGEEDKWDTCGRAYFAERVQHFTSRGTRVELCLPAFPCKSSNTDKVTGKDPDYGERLALERLHGFVEELEKIYEPGAKLWIISDGHVFSDCSMHFPPSHHVQLVYDANKK